MTRSEELRVGDETARLVVAGEPGRPGVALFHAWWGLNDDIVAFAERLAGAGYVVVGPDAFGGEVATTVERAEELATGSDEARVEAIALAAVDRLTELAAADRTLAAVGFSFGAPWALGIPVSRPRVGGSIVYYGSTGGSVLTATSVPVLGHFAEDDPYEPADWVAEFEGTLRGAGRDVTLHRYPGTGHWFAEPSTPAYERAASELAFERTLAFLEKLR